MKRVFILAAMIGVFLCISPFAAFAADDPCAEMVDELDGILVDFDIPLGTDDLMSLSFGELVGAVRDRLADRLSAPAKLGLALFLVIVFGSVMKSFSGAAVEAQSADIYGMVCVMAAVAVLLPRLLDVYGEVLRVVGVCGGFVSVFVPVMTAVSVGCGKLGSAGVYHIMILTASELMVRLSEAYLMPLLSVMAAVAVTGSVFPETSMESLAGLLKKAVVWLISVAMTLFTGFVSLKCSIAGRADGAASKTAKMLVSGLVPVVGGAVSDAYSTVMGSFEVVGGTVGAAGIIGVAIIVLPPFIELLAYRLVMWAGAAAADIFSAEEIARLLKSIDGGLAIAQGVLVSYMMMFVVCSAILMRTLG